MPDVADEIHPALQDAGDVPHSVHYQIIFEALKNAVYD